MNRQQAINYLLSSGFSEEQINTIEQAFKQESTAKNDLVVDCISRADALDSIAIMCSSEELDIDFTKLLLLQRAIKALPSVTPQPMVVPIAEVKTDEAYQLDYEGIQNIVVAKGMSNKEVFKAVFGYEPETDSLICNKGELCYSTPQCNYCSYKPDNQHSEQDWWNAPYKEIKDGNVD